MTDVTDVTDVTVEETEAAAPPVSSLRFLGIWLLLGAQSFGGGSVVLAMIRRAAVEEYGWISETEFNRDWALIQLAPGINLIALTILIGRRVLGRKGVALALAGLILPSAFLTVLLTALYVRFSGRAEVRAALRGVLPVTVGLGLRTAWLMALPLLRGSARESQGSFVLSLFLLLGSGAAAVVWVGLPVVLLLCGAGAIAALHRLLRTAAGGRAEGL
ncbi:MAG: chromate transporter [Cytophagales bacterium]|nr:chromate transporter [Armatimonadota bacterium]